MEIDSTFVNISIWKKFIETVVEHGTELLRGVEIYNFQLKSKYPYWKYIQFKKEVTYVIKYLEQLTIKLRAITPITNNDNTVSIDNACRK